MAAGRYDLEVEQGATFTLPVTWREPTIDGVQGAVRDLSSGWTAALKVRPKKGSSTVLLSLTQAAGIALAATAPNITITITDTQTTSSITQSGVYDLELTRTSDGRVFRVLQGKVLYDLNVTT